MARPKGTPLPFDLPEYAPAFDPEAFEAQIRDQGVRLVHYRAMRCPVGMVDVDDVLRRPHEHHADCSNGFLYTRAGTVSVGFMGNSREARYVDWGRLEGSTAQIVIATHYDAVGDAPAPCCGSDQEEVDCGPLVPVEMCQFDRLYLDEESVTVVNWQLFEANASGTDRLQFPAVRVVDLVDSSGKRYAQGADFDVVRGQIVWAPGRSPGLDPRTQRGQVCSVRYAYRPFWYVERMVHEVRVAQTHGPDRAVRRMPQNALIKREIHFEKEQRDADAPSPNSQRQHPEPEDGSFGPR